MNRGNIGWAAGAAIGVILVVVAWGVDLAARDLGLSPAALVEIHRTNLVHFLLEAAVLALPFAGYALVQVSSSQERAARANERARAAAGEVERLEGLVRDLTAERDATAAQRDEAVAQRDVAAAQRDEAERAGQDKVAYVAASAHELRTPLNAIIGYAEIVFEDLAPDSPTAKDQARIVTAARALLGMVNDMLDLSKIEAGKASVVIEPVQVAPVVEAAVDSVRPIAEKRGNKIVVQVAPAVHAVRGDPERLRQVLINLLSNASKFTTDGTITLAADREGTAVLFRVTDTGVGMSPADVGKLFQPYTQVGARERKAGGTGLGLVISRQFARLMGGDITVSSKLGSGSTFTVRLEGNPRRRMIHPPTLPPGPYTEEERPAPPPDVAPTVMVVTGDPSFTAAVTGFLLPEGYRVASAPTVDEAVRVAASSRAGLALVDMGVADAFGARPPLSALGAVPVVCVAESLPTGALAAEWLVRPLAREPLIAAVTARIASAGGPIVLLVDRDVASNQAIGDALTRGGCSVREATTGEQALSLIVDGVVDESAFVLIGDVSDIDVAQLFASLRSQERRKPGRVFILGGGSGHQPRRGAHVAGFLVRDPEAIRRAIAGR